MHSNIGYIATLCLNLSLLLPLANNAKVDNYVIVLTNGYWVILGIWWCKSYSLFTVQTPDIAQSSSNNQGLDRLSQKGNIISPLVGSR